MEGFDRAHVERLRQVVASRLGLEVEDDKLDMLADVLQRRLRAARKSSADSYLYALNFGNGASDELRELAALLTISETYFFRSPEHFRALTAVAVPQRMEVVRWSHPLRILSAGCASGDEAYSAAILLREQFPQISNLEITGIDINPAMLAKARRAQYSAWALRETPAELREKYFQPNGTGFRLHPQICRMVAFQEGNVAVANGSRWDEVQHDIIFCRNLIMYLVPAAARLAVARLTNALAPGGYLFLSHAETLRGMSHDFHLRHTHDAFYYQKRDTGHAPVATPPRVECPPPEVDASWVEAVRRASENIASLSRDATELGVRTVPTPVETPAPCGAPMQLGFALDLLRREKYKEALDALGQLPSDTASGSDLQVLRAVLLTNLGDISAAEALCQRLLLADELNPSAHYLLALCREHAHDPDRAREHDEAAIYVDPLFSMPHLHLGLLAKRAGSLEVAQRELQQAGALLPREDASRILLLGGGFSREALLEFIHAQIRACEVLS